MIFFTVQFSIIFQKSKLNYIDYAGKPVKKFEKVLYSEASVLSEAITGYKSLSLLLFGLSVYYSVLSEATTSLTSQ